MLRLVKASRIKPHIELNTLQYLREVKIVSKFIEEVRKCNFDFDTKPKLTIASINLEDSIYGKSFWTYHYQNCQFFKHHVIKKRR